MVGSRKKNIILKSVAIFVNVKKFKLQLQLLNSISRLFNIHCMEAVYVSNDAQRDILLFHGTFNSYDKEISCQFVT